MCVCVISYNNNVITLIRDILDLNDIQKGLTGLVHEQGETIDVIGMF